jgi:hypothetical protein
MSNDIIQSCPDDITQDRGVEALTSSWLKRHLIGEQHTERPMWPTRMLEAKAKGLSTWKEAKMVLLKACTRCGGDLHETEDIYGAYHDCLQCGHLIDVLDVPKGLSVKEVAQKTEAAA